MNELDIDYDAANAANESGANCNCYYNSGGDPNYAGYHSHSYSGY